MDEKKLISLTDDIVDAIVDISIGRGKMKAVMPGTITKKLVNDETLFLRLKKCLINYLSEVENKIDDMSELKRLSEFRYELHSIYSGETGEDIDSEI